MTHFKPLFTAVALLLLLTSGCAGLGSLWKTAPAYPLATKERPATQIVAMWRPSRGTHEGRPTRGFAGNIMFFTAKDTMPAIVNGKVRVYVFDDQGTIEEQGKPICQYDFPAAAWNTYAQLSKIGPSYNVFIPYPRPGSHEANCTVSLRLIPEDGGPALFSEEAYITLDGTRNDDKLLVRTSNGTNRKDTKNNAPPPKQSFSIVHDTKVPHAVQPASAKSTNNAHNVQSALAEQFADADSRGDETIERVNLESIAADADDRSNFIRSRIAAHRARRQSSAGESEQQSPTRHPLNPPVNPLSKPREDDDEFSTDHEDFTGHDEADHGRFNELLRETSSRKIRRHPLGNGSDVITVNISGLRHDDATRRDDESRTQRLDAAAQQRHPLAELEEDGLEASEADRFSEFDDEAGDVAIPLTQ